MREMPARQFPLRTEYNVVIGPCPGCDSWQLDYTNAVEKQYVRAVPRVERFEEFEFGSEEPVLTHTSTAIDVDTSEWHELIETILQEHLAECPHLRDLVENY